MKTTKIAAFVCAALFTGLAGNAHADVITYNLTDTPHAKEGLHDAGFYKRVGGEVTFQSLSFEQNGAAAQFVYDEDAGSARLFGQAYNINEGGLFDFDLTYDNVSRNGDTISLGDMDTVGAFDGTTVTGKGFTLTLGDTLTGDGWLINAVEGRHFGDFHFAGVVVPSTSSGGGGQVPAPGPLGLIAAMGLFGLWRRKRMAAK